MAFSSIFNTFLFTEQIDTIDNAELERYSYDYKKNEIGVTKSNFVGWQSDTITLPNEQISLLSDTILDKLNSLKSTLGYKQDSEVYLNNLWININPTASFNRPHIHIDCSFSGVYYVKCNNESGNIVLIHPSASQQFSYNRDVMENFSTFTALTWSVTPDIGRLVIFPSWIQHYVEPNTSNEDRISIAFNAEIQRKNNEQ